MDRALRVCRWIALLPAIGLVMAFMIVFFAAIPGEKPDLTPWWVDVIAGPIGVWAALITAETIAPTHKRETVNVVAGLWIAPFAIHYILRTADIISEPIQMGLMGWATNISLVYFLLLVNNGQSIREVIYKSSRRNA